MPSEAQKVLIVENERVHSHELANAIPENDTLVFSTLAGIMEYFVAQLNKSWEQRDKITAIIVDGDLSNTTEETSISKADGESVINFIKRTELFSDGSVLLIGNYEECDLDGVDFNLRKNRAQYPTVHSRIQEKERSSSFTYDNTIN